MPKPKTPVHDVPESLAGSDPDAYRLLTHDLVPGVEFTITVDDLTLGRQDLHQVTGVMEAWLPRHQAEVIRVKDFEFDPEGREEWTGPIPGEIVMNAMEHGFHRDDIEWATPHGVRQVSITVEWDPRGCGPDEIMEFYK